MKNNRAARFCILAVRLVLLILMTAVLPLNFTIAGSLPEVPGNLTAYGSPGIFIIFWGQVSGVDRYELEIDGGAEMVITDQTIYFHSGLEQEHTYRVRARNATGTSDWSGPITASNKQETVEPGQEQEQEPQPGQEQEPGQGQEPEQGQEPGQGQEPEQGDPVNPGEVEQDLPEAPAGIAALPEDTAITVTWDAVEGAEGYDVEVDGAVEITSSQAITYRDEGLEPDTRHSYRVRTAKGGVRSEWSPEFTCRTLLSAPADLCAIAGIDSVTLTWNTTGAAITYEVEIDGAETEVTALKEYVHSGLSSGETHKYRVRARSGDNVGVWSGIVQTRTLEGINYNVDCIKGDEFNLVLTSYGIDKYEGFTFRISYNADELEATDLCALTPGPDLTAGGAPGSEITVISYVPGEIEFISGKKVDQADIPLTILNKVRFRANTSCTASLLFTMSE